MWRHYPRKWSSTVLAAVALYLGFGGRPVLADHHGHNQNYEAVQGYIIQPQTQQACVSVAGQSTTPSVAIASGQNQGNTLGLAPAAPQQAAQTMTLQLTPAQAPVQTLQLAPAPVQVQTLQLAAAPVQVQTLQLAPAPVQVQTLQLAAAPVQVQTLQLAPQQFQTAIPVTILLPSHKCHWLFCRHRN
jgi:hypothetical protein